MKNQTTHQARTMLALFATSTLLLLAGCGSSSSGGTPAPPVAAVVCPTGTVLSGSSCVFQQSTNSTVGFYAQSSNFPQGMYMNNGSNLIEDNAMSTLLADAMGVCNRGHYNGGLADCDTWYGGYYDLVFMVNQQDPNKVTVVFRAYPVVDQFHYSYNLPTVQQFFLSFIGFPVANNPQGVFNPLILNATISPISQSQGLEIRSYGPRQSPAYNDLLQLQVASGKVEDQAFQFRLMFKGQQAASGTMVRCQSLTCGL